MGDVDIDLFSSHRRNAKALWAGMTCYLGTRIGEVVQEEGNEYLVDELEPALLFGESEISADITGNFLEGGELHRSVLNTVLVPRNHVSAIGQLSARHSVEYAKQNNFWRLVEVQLSENNSPMSDSTEFFYRRNRQVVEFVRGHCLQPERLNFVGHFG